MRDQGCMIALDDVGAVPESLALLPFIAPDVIQLDLSLVQGWPNADQARILTAASAYSERSGATILAEGIETEADRDRAVGLGATLGQGWYFGGPGPLTVCPDPPRRLPRLDPGPAPVAATPFDLLPPHRIRLASKGLLLPTSRHIEQQGRNLQTPPVVLSAFQDAAHFTPDTIRRYEELARRCSLVVAFGIGMPADPAVGVRDGSIDRHDPLSGEWSVVVVGPHYSGALIARDFGDTGPDLERRFLFAVTHDHDTVLAAAHSLLNRIGAH